MPVSGASGTLHAPCNHPGPLADGASLPPISLEVLPDASAVPSVVNTAAVSGTLYDNVSGNDSSGDATTVVGTPDLLVMKSAVVLSDLDPACGGRGLGTGLYERLLQALGEAGYHLAIGGISLPNPASVALHEKMGFEKIGQFREIRAQGPAYTFQIAVAHRRMQHPFPFENGLPVQGPAATCRRTRPSGPP